jgi:hypothetical protein
MVSLIFPSWPGKSAKRVFALAIHDFLAWILQERGCPGHDELNADA